jgi:hypothetical protein
MARSYEERMGMAAAALEAGFHTKAARKIALEQAQYAFEIVAGEIKSLLLADPADQRETKAWQAEYYGLPYSLSSWRPRHAEMFNARFAGRVEMIEAAVALREKIKAAPEVERPVKPKTEAQLAWEAQALTCQVCGRPICAKTGVIAHHGYERPGTGYQTASCEGARELPFEVDRDALGSHIVNLRLYVEGLETVRPKVEAEEVALVWSFTDYSKPIGLGGHAQTQVTVTRETFETMKAATEAKRRGYGNTTFDLLKAARLRSIDSNLEMTRQAIEHQQGRYDGWKQTHRREGAEWVEV